LGAAAEFERSLIRERTQAGRLRYQQDYNAGKAGKTVYSRSGKNLPICRPKRIFNRERVIRIPWLGRRDYRQLFFHSAVQKPVDIQSESNIEQQRLQRICNEMHPYAAGAMNSYQATENKLFD